MPRIATTFWGKNELFTALLLSHRLEHFLIAKRFKLNRTGHKITVSEGNNKKAQLLIPCAVLTTTAVMVWRNDVLIEEDDALSWFIHMVQVHFDLLLLWAIVICNLLHSTVQTKTIDRFLQLDRKLRTAGLRIDNLSIRRTSFLWFFVNVGLTLTVFAYYILKMGEDFRYLWAHCVYLISNVYKIFLAVVVRDWIISIKTRMDAVVRYLRDVTRRSQTAKEISERSANLMELMDVCGGFNRIYSVPMLVNMMCNFTQIIIGLYRYSTVLTELPVSHILFIAIGISTFAMNAVVNIWVCSTLSNYVSICMNCC